MTLLGAASVLVCVCVVHATETDTEDDAVVLDNGCCSLQSTADRNCGDCVVEPCSTATQPWCLQRFPDIYPDAACRVDCCESAWFQTSAMVHPLTCFKKKACKNMLIKGVSQLVSLGSNNEQRVYDSCSNYIQDFPIECSDEQISGRGGLCCRACKKYKQR